MERYGKGVQGWDVAYRSRARSSMPRRPWTAGEGVDVWSSKPCFSRMLRMSVEAWSAGMDMMEANREGNEQLQHV